MTKKRFQLLHFNDNEYIIDLNNDGNGTYEVLDIDMIVDLLNKQDNTITFLKANRIIESALSPTYSFYNFDGTPICHENIYHRTCRQLKEHLKNGGFLVSSVSRVHIGRTEFYHVEFNLHRDEWDYHKTNDLSIGKYLKIKDIGLVDYHEQDNIIHEVILINEKEVNDKYLKDGNLVFE